MPIRISGLGGSGLDTDQLVKDLMKAKRISYDKVWQNKTQLEWKKAEYNSMYTAINDFRNNTVSNYKFTSTTLVKKAVSNDDTKVTVTANADASNVNHSLEITQLAEGANKTSSGTITTAGNAKDTLATQFGLSGSFDIKINAKTITVDTSKSINEFVSQMNAAGANVKANYDVTLDRFFINSTDTGATAKIDFAGSSAAGLDFIGTNLKINTGMAIGKDAEFIIDGTSLTQRQNTFNISGVTYNLKSKTEAGKPVNVAISSDTDKVVANVKTFIEAYNKMLDKVNTELNETKYKGYMPLTDEQKADMKETDVKLWEDKARSGLFARDSNLREVVDKMRNNIASPIVGLTGSYTTASSIGITSGAYYEHGKLYLDEDKLKKALEADPEIAHKIFSTSGSVESEKGIAGRLWDTLKVTADKIAIEAGKSASAVNDLTSTLGKRINDFTTNLTKMESRLTDMENNYYMKFSALETALSRMSKQSSWLSQTGG